MLLRYLWPLRKEAPEIALTSLFLWDLNPTSRNVDSLDNHLLSRWYLNWNSNHFEDYYWQCATRKKIFSMLKGKSKLELIWDLSGWICKLIVNGNFFYTLCPLRNKYIFMELQKQVHKQTHAQKAEGKGYGISDLSCSEDVHWPHTPYLVTSLFISQWVSLAFLCVWIFVVVLVS